MPWDDGREPEQPELFEIVRRTVTGSDQREGTTFYKNERLGVYSSRVAALEGILKMNPTLIIQPLKMDG